RALESKRPRARGKTEVVSSGVDLERFRPIGAHGPTHVYTSPSFLCVGALSERKNVLRLARAFERLGEGTLVFAGDGPLRARLEDRSGIRLLGRTPHDRVPELIADADVVCQPSLIEPLGQALLEA